MSLNCENKMGNSDQAHLNQKGRSGAEARKSSNCLYVCTIVAFKLFDLS
jgi:hypothetical protein